MCIFRFIACARQIVDMKNEKREGESSWKSQHRRGWIRRTRTDRCLLYDHTYIHTYLHIYIHTHVHTYIHAYINTCMHTSGHTVLMHTAHTLTTVSSSLFPPLCGRHVHIREELVTRTHWTPEHTLPK